MIWKNASRICIPLVLPCIDGVIPVLAVSGALIPENALGIAFSVLAGPAALITAASIEGEVKTRIFSALLAGMIATVAITLAALLGGKLTTMLNVKILRIFAALALGTIALQIAEVKIPQGLPVAIVFIGFILAFYLNFS